MGSSENDAGRGKDHMVLRNERNDSAQIGRRRYREGGDGSAVRHAEEHPSVEKCGQIAIRFTQVNVLSAGVGKHRTQFGESNAGAQGNYTAQNPNQQEQQRMRQRSGNIFGRQENRRPDDAAGQQQHRIEKARVREPAWAVILLSRLAAKKPKAGSFVVIPFRVRQEIPAEFHSDGK